MNKIAQFPQLMGVAINFVTFPLISLSEVGIRSCRFHEAAGPGTRVNFICVAPYSPDHKALTCKSYMSNPGFQMNERMHKSGQISCIWIWIAIWIGLEQDCGISSLLLGYRSQSGHKSINELLNLAKLGSRNGMLPEATGHRAVCTPLQTTLELSLRIPCGI